MIVSRTMDFVGIMVLGRGSTSKCILFPFDFLWVSRSPCTGGGIRIGLRWLHCRSHCGVASIRLAICCIACGSCSWVGGCAAMLW